MAYNELIKNFNRIRDYMMEDKMLKDIIALLNYYNKLDERSKNTLVCYAEALLEAKEEAEKSREE